MQKIGDGQAQVGYSVAGLSRGWVTLCAVCTVHKETLSTGFLVEPQNQGRWVSWFGPQNHQVRFGDFGPKITATVFWFGLQNQASYGLPVVLQNRWEEDGVRHASRSSGLLRLEASRARVSQFCLKTSGGVTAGGAHGIITEVAWK
jgi:hypothetical protein